LKRDHCECIRRSALWSAFAVLLFAAGQLPAGTIYTFQIVAQTGQVIGGQTITDFGLSPVVNNSGTVAFLATYDGFGSRMIATQDGVVVQTGDTIGGKTLGWINDPSLNAGGTVAFSADYPGGEGIFTQNGAVALEGDTIAGYTLTGFGTQPAINASGTLAFLGNYNGGQDFGIFTKDSVLVKEGDTLDGLTLDHGWGNPVLNAGGTVAFIADYFNPGFGEGIFTQNGAVAHTGTIIGGHTLAAFGQPAIPSLNDSGTAAFASWYFTGQGVFT
jgi:hypothetical protein